MYRYPPNNGGNFWDHMEFLKRKYHRDGLIHEHDGNQDVKSCGVRKVDGSRN